MRKHITKIKNALIILSILYYGNTFAQSSSTNFYFCALNGTCYNEVNNDNPKVSRILEEYSPQQKIELTEAFMENYPQYVVVDSASLLYNCHGFAYSVYQGGEKVQITWDSTIYSNNGALMASYVIIDSTEARLGDIVTAVEQESWGDLTSRHSAIVINEDTLLSKWGNSPLFKHRKYDSLLSVHMGLGVSSHYVYYRRIINTPNYISGPYTFNGTGVYDFYPSITPTSCSWSVEPAAMFQVSSGTGYRAILNYRTPFVYLAPKATITFTFSYGCDNHYTVSKEFDLRIPTTTISGNAISDGFVIDANAIVTVTGNIKNNKNAKTIVPIGTKLILDGGTMTSNEDGMWPGIEVWGNSSMHQQPIQGQYGQGYIELKNGAVIENAKCAVELWQPEHYSTTGGIIHATDATFRNNAMALRAVCYNNYNHIHGTPMDYNGYFINCSFVVDESYLGTEVFKKHVNLADVIGIGFTGCDFSAKRVVQGVDPWCVGITAYNSSFIVQSLCTSNLSPCPEADLDKTTFTGLCSGIYATSSGDRLRSFTVRDAVFTNNDRGIQAKNTTFPTILKNEFNIGQETYCSYNYGIYLEGISNFCIEENTFQPVSSPGSNTFGIAVYDSYGVNDVYLNHFKNLSCSVFAKGQNGLTSAAGDIVGLTLTCNTNEGNHNDFRVSLKDGVGDIQSQQGSYTQPAGNTFGASGYQFDNQGEHWIDYYYNDTATGQTPNSTKVNRVYLHGTSNYNPCNTHYGGGSVDKSASEKAALESAYLSAYTA